MEVKEAERVVIAKPVPLRPTCSDLGSFSNFLAGDVEDFPPNKCPETVIAAIRPKTVRFRPMVTGAAATIVSSKADFSGKAVDNLSDQPGKQDSRSCMVYKPKAKLVSKATVSFLANMDSNGDNLRQIPQSLETCVQTVNQGKQNLRSQLTVNVCQNIPLVPEAEQTIQRSKTTASDNLEENPKIPPSFLSGDRPSHDGYNWRKYGQKYVKGSEYPRSYYKCTYANCPVKKKLERSVDGQITEIVYQGEHDHPKPYPPRHSSSGTQRVGLASEGSDHDRVCNSSWANQLNERNEGTEGRVGNTEEARLHPRLSSQSMCPATDEPVALGGVNSAAGASDSCGPNSECDEASKALVGEDDEPTRRKRRKTKNQSSEASMSVDGSQEPRAQQSSVDSEILEDGFRWRKYGQKVVRGNLHPRSYYRCTSPKCGARKHVERASDDPRAFITTYEGKHNHEMPLRSTCPLISQEGL